MQRSRLALTALVATAAAVLVACGGGDTAGVGGPTTSFSGGSAQGAKATISSVKVYGDSLADIGTFGIKATVQNAAAPATGYPLWNERVATTYGVTLCPYYRANAAPVANCTNYAVGGGAINGRTGSASAPLSIAQQMQAGAANIGSYGAGDLVLIDGGGNDAADLARAFVGASTNPTPFLTLVQSLLPASTVQSILAAHPGAAGLANLGGAYMQALAAKFAVDINTHVLANGATRVAVLNMPGIVNTPDFRGALAMIAAQTSQAQADSVKAAIEGWTQAFNSKLAAAFDGNEKVLVVDFYRAFADQVAMPAQFALTNATTPACPNGITNGCTDAALSAAPPSGATGGADWWKTWAFSDGFHPTPYGHQLLGQVVSLALARKGWL